MKVGDVYYWITDRAVGYKSRPKFHIYIGDAGWREDGIAFLFINSDNYNGSDYPLYSKDYPFLTNEVSFVSCNDFTVYPQSYLATVGPQFVGSISKGHLMELREAVARSDFMEHWKIVLVCGVLVD